MTTADEPAQASLLADVGTLVRTAWRLDRKAFVLQLVLLLIASFAGGVSLLLLIPIVNSVAQPTTPITLPILGSFSLSSVPLWTLLAAFVGLTAVTALVTRSATVQSTAMQQRIVDAMRQEAFAAILAARWSYVLGQQKSDIVEVVTIGASRSGMAYQQLVQFAITALLFVVTAVVALLVSPAVAGISLVGVILLGLARATAIRPAHRMGREFGRRNRELQAVIQDSMDSLRLVRAHGASAVWAERLASAFSSTRTVQLANVRHNATITAWSAVGLSAAASALVLLAVQADVSPAALVIVLLLVARLAREVLQLATAAALMANALPAVQDLSALTAQARQAVESPARASRRPAALQASVGEPLLELREVSFTYPRSENGITDASLVVPAGRITALSGPSGAGKSTVADLALGLLEPDRGAVLVDGTPLIDDDLQWWRSHVAYVPQETILLPSTLRENLTWSTPGEDSDQECWTALDRASATFARELPEGLDTLLGDRGLRLSGGERQRVAIARALLRRPSLLVLDEATSALDEATEAQVIELMRSLVPAVTVLVIAHRRSTLDTADRVIRLEAGHVIDESA